MTWADVLDSLERSPKAFTFWGTYRDMCVYISGYDHVDGEVLRGFQAWLAARNPEDRSLAFPGLVAKEALGPEFRRLSEMTPEQDVAACAKLLELLRQYLRESPADEA